MVFFQTSGLLVRMSMTSETYQAPYHGEVDDLRSLRSG